MQRGWDRRKGVEMALSTRFHQLAMSAQSGYFALDPEDQGNSTTVTQTEKGRTKTEDGSAYPRNSQYRYCSPENVPDHWQVQ